MKAHAGKGSAALELLLSDKDYDFVAIHQRAVQAMRTFGKDIPDILRHLGRNYALPIAYDPAFAPTVGNITKIAQYFGVSVAWLLTGQIENDVDLSVSRGEFAAVIMPAPPADHSPYAANLGDVSGGAVLQGVTAGNITVQHYGPAGLSRTESDVIDLLRRLPPAKKAEALSFLLSLDNAQ